MPTADYQQSKARFIAVYKEIVRKNPLDDVWRRLHGNYQFTLHQRSSDFMEFCDAAHGLYDYAFLPRFQNFHKVEDLIKFYMDKQLEADLSGAVNKKLAEKLQHTEEIIRECVAISNPHFDYATAFAAQKKLKDEAYEAQLKYRDLCNKLVNAQFAPNYSYNQMVWSDARAKQHEQASKEFYENYKLLYPKQDFSKEFTRLKKASLEKHNNAAPFWIAADIDLFPAASIDNYINLLEILVHQQAHYKFLVNNNSSKQILSDKEKVVNAALHNFRLCEHSLIKKGYQPPELTESPKDLVKRSVLLAQQNELRPNQSNARKNENWELIMRFAQAKYGPTALVNSFYKQANRATHTATKKSVIDYPKNNYARFFFKAFLIIAGLSVITLGVASAVASFGLASPLALAGAYLGVGAIMTAAGIVPLATCFGLNSHDKQKKAAIFNSVNLRAFYTETEVINAKTKEKSVDCTLKPALPTIVKKPVLAVVSSVAEVKPATGDATKTTVTKRASKH